MPFLTSPDTALSAKANMNSKTTTQASQTDWKAVDAMEDEDIDFSDLPEIPPEKFANAIIETCYQIRMKRGEGKEKEGLELLEKAKIDNLCQK